MIDILTPIQSRPGLSAPVRNRYFYGKLLDVHNLQMEQDYFLEMGRLINRLTLGSGVLCGLRVKRGTGRTLLVSPGVAVDGYGREIVVTEQVTIDLAELERETSAELGLDSEAEAEGDVPAQADPVGPTPVPTPIRLTGSVLCLSYHECPVEPSPVLVADCDLREECVPGAVRERFKFSLMPAAYAPLPEDPCSIMRGPTQWRTPYEPTQPTLPGESTQVMETRLASALREIEHVGGVTPELETAAAMRQRLCDVYHPPCGPGSACVPVALIAKGPRGGITVDECLPRRTIYSNAVLLDLILCLAEQMERCCQRKVTVTAPKIVDTFPPPPKTSDQGQTEPTTLTLAAFQKVQLEQGGVAISFDRAMNQSRLEAPDEWLRVFVIPMKEGIPGVKMPLKLDRTEAKTVSGKKGQTAYYAFQELSIDTGGGALSNVITTGRQISFGDLIDVGQGALVLMLIRSDDVTQIVAKDDSELLDADFFATSLTTEMTDLMWSIPLLSAGTGSSLRNLIATPPSPMPTLPSGNNIEGGVFHSSFIVKA
jgi:hypothetical protein